MQWTPECFSQFISSAGEVQVWIAKDESCVSTTDSGAACACMDIKRSGSLRIRAHCAACTLVSVRTWSIMGHMLPLAIAVGHRNWWIDKNMPGQMTFVMWSDNGLRAC
jgi:hypothetical protein